MNLLISGCSFTQWPEYPGGPNICWPKFLKDQNPDWTIENLAEPAAGNQYIADSVIRSVIKTRPDHVLVMWSGVSRLDYLTSLEDPAWERLFDSYGFYRRVEDCPNQLGYIFSGGQMGTWYKNDVAHKMFYEMYKVSSPMSLASINLMEIVKLQNFLQNKGIPYHFMSYVNYWNSKEHVSPNGDFGVMAFSELNDLISEIDFDPWIFADQQRNGIYELALQQKDFQPDGFHPGIPIYQQWANTINDHLHKALIRC
jgi:hypothetical protein